MNRRDWQDEVFKKAEAYKELRAVFKKFCTEAREVLLQRPQFDVEFKTGTDLSCDVLILGHLCTARFGVRESSRGMIGSVTFERVVAKDEVEQIWTLFFDALENATDKPENEQWYGTVSGPDLKKYVAVKLLEQMLKSLLKTPAAAAAPQG